MSIYITTYQSLICGPLGGQVNTITVHSLYDEIPKCLKIAFDHYLGLTSVVSTLYVRFNTFKQRL